MKNTSLLFAILLFSASYIIAQPSRWQQSVKYKMKIDFDVDTHTYKGEQELKYYNNSPDTLTKVYYHLYFNAFQPGSMMDVRSRTISDPDRRVGDRISHLRPDEIGYQVIDELKQDGQSLQYDVVGTILEVILDKPILPHKNTTFKMKYRAQVPIQIRRSGRDNAEGIDYSMSQWYPKMVEYDIYGWHANPYVGKEFYGVWGDYEVEIKINGRYTVAAGGVLTNAKKIGRGYSDKQRKIKDKKVTWKWKAQRVHDFVWAADRDYVVDHKVMYDGTTSYFVYQPGERTTETWKALPDIMDAALQYADQHFGKYPYPVYSFIQGGDGGMEYPMATLITGNRSLSSLVGVSVHEWMHSWYQMVLGSNESLYAYLDEGFTSYASSQVMNYLKIQKLIPGRPVDNPMLNSVNGLLRFHKSGLEEPLSIHSDHFMTNAAYGVGAYTKGSVMLEQLKYIVGEDALSRGLKNYYNLWKFKHPNVYDFIRVMEKASGLELDWFQQYYCNTTDYPDYAVLSVADQEGKTNILLGKIGRMPMPIDLVITYKDSTKTLVNIPLRIMRGHKTNEVEMMQYILAKDWPWTNPEYVFTLDVPLDDIAKIEIDPSQRMLDLNRDNNFWVADPATND